MQYRSFAWVVTAILAVPALAQTPPTSQPASEPASGDLQRQLQELLGRMSVLEQQHAAEREQDRKRIADLEARIVELESPALETERRKAFSDQIAAMRAEIARTNGQSPASQPEGGAENELDALIGGATAGETPSSQPTGISGGLRSAIQSFNPDMSLNADFTGTYRNHEGGNPERKFVLRELELGFSGNVDPYTRADMIVTVGANGGEWTVDLEEGYLTYLQLPYNLQMRFGKFRSEFGRANPIHLHALPWTDYPFVIQRYFGEEGMSGVGGELSWLVPNPWNQYIALIYEISNNDNSKIFAGDEADDITHLLRLKSFRDLSNESTLEFGGSFATGPNDRFHGNHRSMVEGLDLTYRWKPKGQGLYKSFLWQTEILAAQADIREGQEATWGMYSAVEYQFERQWKLGFRFDRTQLPFSSSSDETGYSTYLTFLQSEFVFWRLAYLFIDRNFRDNGVGDEQRVQLQLNWTLGAHPAHKY